MAESRKWNIYNDLNIRETYFSLSISSVGLAVLNHVLLYVNFKVVWRGRGGTLYSNHLEEEMHDCEGYILIGHTWKLQLNSAHIQLVRTQLLYLTAKKAKEYGPAESSLRRNRLWCLWTFTVQVSRSRAYNWLWSPAAVPLGPPLYNKNYAKSNTISHQGTPFSIPSFLPEASSMKL